jgi:hypothetical protein
MMGVTLVAVLVATIAVMAAWRLRLEQQERSAARVAALAAAIEGTAAPVDTGDGAAAVAGGEVRAVRDGLFTSPQGEIESPAWLRLAPAALAGLLIAGLAIAWMAGSAGAAATAAPDRGPAPLELLSLRHTAAEGRLTVTGLVRNPAGNEALQRGTAVVFLFDATGGFLGSGRAPLDFASLAAGEESPFVVGLDAPAGVARYRVSFRVEDTGVIRHIDRRQARLP